MNKTEETFWTVVQTEEEKASRRDENRRKVKEILEAEYELLLSGKVEIDENSTTTKAFCRDRGSYMIE